jgi:PadR family transcriptional regulator PadR
MIRDFFVAFIRIHVLHHAGQKPLYGLWLIEELRHHGYKVSPGTVYPMLHSLVESGYLVREKRVVDGKERKYYVITRAGRQVLRRTLHQLVELVREVLEGQTDLPLRLASGRARTSKRRPARKGPGRRGTPPSFRPA